MSHRDFAPTPPMGWNSWDCFAATVNEAQLMENAEYMRRHLLPHGWRYIVCDIQWFEPLAGSGDGEYRPFAELHMDEYGRLLPAENRFPSGFARIADKLHDMGLLFGIHIMRGIPRLAAHRRLPVFGTNYTADEIASPSSICKWNSDMYGLRASHPGAQAYYDSIFALYAEWGVDFVKVDDICNTNAYPHDPYSARGEIELIRRTIDKTGRPMVLSLSPGPAIINEAWHLSQNANMWRMTDDFWDTWPQLKDMFRRCELWQAHVGGGVWPDCDMLPLGQVGIGFKSPRETRFTPDEQITLLSLWCIFRSPLMMGGHLPLNSDFTLSLLSNDEVIAVNQLGANPRQLCRSEREAVWCSDAPDGGLYAALFNLSDEEASVALPCELTRFASARDLWNRRDLGTPPAAITLPAHGSALLLLRNA